MDLQQISLYGGLALLVWNYRSYIFSLLGKLLAGQLKLPATNANGGTTVTNTGEITELSDELVDEWNRLNNEATILLPKLRKLKEKVNQAAEQAEARFGGNLKVENGTGKE